MGHPAAKGPELEKRLYEWAMWYHENKDRIPKNDLKQKSDFLMMAIDGVLEVCALSVERLQKLEEGRASPIILPPAYVRKNYGGA